MKHMILYCFGIFPGQPYLFTAKVASYLKNKKIDVFNYDANLAVWEYILNPEYLQSIEYRPEIFKKCPIFLAKNISYKKFLILKKNVIENIEEALRILKDKKDFYNIRKLNWAHFVIFNAQKLIYYQYGTFIGLRTVFWPKIGFKIKEIDDIYKISTDIEHNLFIDIFSKVILPEIDKIKPRIIGIEMFFPWEIIQVLTLNFLIKKNFPNIHLNFLGQGFDEIIFSRIADNMKQDKRFMFEFDTIFMARNYEELYKLYSLKELNNNELSKINSIAYIKDKEVLVKGPFHEGDMDFNNFPDYSDLPLERYFSPHLVFIDKLSSKCFWSQCSYCSINAYKPTQQIADLKMFISRIKHFKQKYNVRHLWLLDEATPPGIINQFSDLLLKEKIELIWSIRTRIDEKLDEKLLTKMHKAGCRELWIGLESVSPKLLKAMNKTSDPENYPNLAAKLMQACNKIGIGIHFCILLGFPTETNEDKELLFKFFKNNKKYMTKIPYFATFNEFWLMKNSEIYNNPKKYGIKEIIEKKNHYNMVDIPFKHIKDNLKNDSKILGIHSDDTEKMAKKLLKFFLKDKSLTLLWFNASDSFNELLLKEKFQNENPFQRRMKLWEICLMLLVLKYDNSPLFSKPVHFLFKKYCGI